MNGRMRFKTKAHNRYGKRHVAGEMTKVEELYAQNLQLRYMAGEIAAWGFERFKLRLADGCFYTPDFHILHNDGSLELIDVKGTGPVDDKSIVKAKVAAQEFFMFVFVMDQQQTRKNGGGFKRREF